MTIEYDGEFARVTHSRAEWLNTAMARMYGVMSFGLLISAVVAMVVANSPSLMALLFGTGLKWVVFLAPLVAVFAISMFRDNMSATALRASFFSYAALMGIFLSTVFKVYTTGSIIGAFVSASALFGVMSVYGYFTKKDLTQLGQLLFFALIGILIAMIVNLFLQSNMFSMIISAAAVLVFLGLTAYDTQAIQKEMWANAHDEHKIATMGALTLYLDILNLFVHLLSLFGIKLPGSDD